MDCLGGGGKRKFLAFSFNFLLRRLFLHLITLVFHYQQVVLLMKERRVGKEAERIGGDWLL
jgi:hypothetical protein